MGRLGQAQTMTDARESNRDVARNFLHASALKRADLPTLRGRFSGSQPQCVLFKARVIGDQVRTVHSQLASGQLETVEVLSESGMYRALWRFSHPENRHLRRWLSHVALPALRDSAAGVDQGPSRCLMAWDNQQVNLLEWQGELWIALGELPRFYRQPHPTLRQPQSWLARWWRGRFQARAAR